MQWLHAADAFTQRYGCPYLYSECRTHYGAVLFAMGHWRQAEQELQRAIELSRDAIPVLHRQALASLAELRVAQGRVEEAERLVAGHEDHEAAVPVWARIHLVRGAPALAAATIRRRLASVGEERLESALLLELLGEAEIEQSDHGSAAERGRRLAEVGETSGHRVAAARGHRLRGRAMAAAGQTTKSRAHLEVALSEFVRLEMPLEVARTRMLFARVVEKQEPQVAVAAARLALATFEDLGVGSDADAAAALLRQLGVSAARVGPRGLEALTKREREVLSLLAEGLSNPRAGWRTSASAWAPCSRCRALTISCCTSRGTRKHTASDPGPSALTERIGGGRRHLLPPAPAICSWHAHYRGMATVHRLGDPRRRSPERAHPCWRGVPLAMRSGGAHWAGWSPVDMAQGPWRAHRSAVGCLEAR